MRLVAIAVVISTAMPLLGLAAPKDDAYQTVTRWADAFNAGRPDEVADLYTPGATLWGTLSSMLTSSPAGIRAYFAAAKAAGARVRLVDQSAIELSDGVIVETGRYDFERTQNGQVMTFPARYSFVLVKQGDTWKIAHHHSSLVPKPSR